VAALSGLWLSQELARFDRRAGDLTRPNPCHYLWLKGIAREILGGDAMKKLLVE